LEKKYFVPSVIGRSEDNMWQLKFWGLWALGALINTIILVAGIAILISLVALVATAF